MKKQKSQRSIILNRLIKYKQVSTVWAIKHYILRLSDIIFKLRKNGYIIKTIAIKNKTNKGSTAKYIFIGIIK